MYCREVSDENVCIIIVEIAEDSLSGVSEAEDESEQTPKIGIRTSTMCFTCSTNVLLSVSPSF